ncbi:MAG TPA: right-handed parallel beta-helix repeat-containing protein [Ferruginibacter sp.]|nr:right-handed parallel beta-helix repeat-containing protein [Ferruginibacter sp.]
MACLFTFFISGLSAKTYYLSSVSGSDAYTVTQAQSQSTPWRSISKLNSVFSSLVAGDSVLFRRGETFYGTLTPTVSGIIFAAYGSGAKPVLSALTTISSWTSAGTNLWRSPALSPASTPSVLTVNNQAHAYGRFPNTGHMFFEASSNAGSITDYQLTGTPNFAGGELVLRYNGFELNRYPITSHSGGTINFSGNTRSLTVNYGYFVQNHLSTLDSQNEWCYSTSARTVTIWSTSTPTNVKVSTLNNICIISRVNNITLRDLVFEGANQTAIAVSNASGININSCDIIHSGFAAVSAVSVSNSNFQNNYLFNNYNNGFDLSSPLNTAITLRNNRITRTGAVPGMGESGSAMVMSAVAICGNNHVIEYNQIDSTGYTPVNFRRCNNLTVKNNLITNYCFVKQDGGGVYTWNNELSPNLYIDNKIIGNIILNGIGAPEGTPDSSNFDVDGVMMDDNASNVTITDNTIAHVNGNGIYIHNNFNMTVLRNTVFNCRSHQASFVHNLAFINGSPSPYTTPLRNITFKNNILFSKTPAQGTMMVSSIRNDFDSMGVADSNYITRPLYEDWTIDGSRVVNNATIRTAYDLNTWKTAFKRDKASKVAARGIPPYTINKNNSSNLISYGTFLSNISGLRFYSANGNNTLSWDNTSKLTGTGSLRINFPSIVSNQYTLLYSSVGAVSSSKNYVLRFKTLGTTDTGFLRAFIRREGTPFDYLTPLQVKQFGKTRMQHEYLFTSPVSVSAAVYAIEIKQSSGTTYVDDIEFFEVDASITNPDNHIRLEYNAATSSKTVVLDGNYIGVDSVFYNGSVTLPPYSSKVLIRDTSKKSTPATSLSLSVNNPAVACFGGNTNVTIAAAGGTAPYTGTGTFNVSAGKGSMRVGSQSSTTMYTLLYSAIGPISANKNYMLRFTTLGTTEAGELRAYIRQTASPYANLTPVQTGNFGTSRQQHVFYFNAPVAAAGGSFLIEVRQSSGTAYLDNIEVFEISTAGKILSANLASNGYFEEGIDGITAWSQNNAHSISWDTTAKINANYTFVVNDAVGNTADTLVTIAQPAAPLSASAIAGTITAAGGTTNVTVSASGGTAPYTGTGTFSSIKAGTYTYTVTDARGCKASVTITITQPASAITATAIATGISCYGGTGSVVISATGGTLPYTGTGTYSIAAGAGTLRLSHAAPVAGRYTKMYGAVGPLAGSKNYMLRFSTLGTVASDLKAGLRQTNSPWSNIVTLQTASFGTSRTDHQFIFTNVAAQTAASFLIEINQAAGTVYIDNVAVFECTTAGAILGDNLFPEGKFLEDMAGVVSWSDFNNQQLAWDNTSKITDTYYFTVRDAASGTSTATVPTTQPSRLTVTATAGIISILGGTTSVVVSATGGTAPYTGTGTFTNILAGTYTYTVTDAKGCTASTQLTITQPAATTTYTLTTSATPSAGGSISRSPNATSYAAGTVVTLTATPAAGYIFTGWSGAVTGTATSVTVTMSANRSVTANFVLAYSLTTTASPSAGGSVSRSPNATTYASGTVVTLTANPAAGYVFTGWSGAVSGTATSTTVTMSANRTVTANFQIQATSTLRIEDDTNNLVGLCGYNGTISSNSGASNGRVVNLSNSTGSAVNWRVTVPATGIYDLNWRYVNSSTSNTFTMRLIVNGVTINSSQPFPRTSGSTVFANSTASVTLVAGTNTIRLEATASPASADIDWLEITGANPQAANCAAARSFAPAAAQPVAAEENTMLTAGKTGIFPNPASSQVKIGFILQAAGRANIRILFADGRLHSDLGTANYPAGYQLVSHQLRNVRPGLYNVVITTSQEKIQVYKLIVQ